MTKQPQHIFLTGFMGSGKTTMGKKLAALLNRNFIDLDVYIEQHEKKTIAFIFDVEGEAVFREMETKSLVEILNITEPSVIALGGGTVCFGNNLELVKNSGLLVYLQLPAPALAERLKNSIQPRPLLKNVKGDALISTIAEKLMQRKFFYEQAHLVVDGLNLNAAVLQQKITDAAG